MDFNPTLLQTRLADNQTRELWPDKTIQYYLDRTVRATPDMTAIVAYRQDWLKPRRISYRELDLVSHRIAVSLTAMGVKRHDVVSFQLPNWWEFIALSLACVRIGAAANPLMPIFREHELTFMLNMTESKVFVVPKNFRHHDYEKMARGLKASLPHLEHVIVIDGEGDDSFDKVLLQEHADEACLLEKMSPLQPDDVSMIMFTSGTTGESKGVMHTSNTILTCVQSLIDRFKLKSEENVLAATPLGHMTGYALFAAMPMILGNTTVLQDVWEVNHALRIIADESVAFSAGSTPFLADFCNAIDGGAVKAASFRLFLCAGAPIPPSLIDRAFERMRLTVCSCWGMTEVVAGSFTPPERSAEKSSQSDGCPLPDVELRIADELGKPLPVGETGRLLIKTPSLFAGYLKRPQLSVLSEGSWFDSGDLAYMDAEGYIRINGRSKDIIIRGGENIPVREVENLLYSHPSVALAAVVAYPDSRMGERACAFVVPKPGMAFTFEIMKEHFNACKVSKQYWPEHLELLDQLPTTASGKIQKFRLREIAKKFGDA